MMRTRPVKSEGMEFGFAVYQRQSKEFFLEYFDHLTQSFCPLILVHFKKLVHYLFQSFFFSTGD